MGEMVVIINILGAVAVLLWGLSMVKAGMVRAFGGALRRWLNAGGSRVGAATAGLAVTVALQSSTATCLMAASFVERGLLEAAPAQAAMLGANLGTALVAKLLTFDVGPAAAALFLAAAATKRAGQGGRSRAVARILFGVGLILLSIRLLDAAGTPVREAPQLLRILADVDGIWLVGVVLAAGLTMLFHSSVATILLIMPLAGGGAFSLPFGVALVLGANLGSALPPILETGRANPVERRVPVGNALIRLVGCAAAVAALDPLLPLIGRLGGDVADQLVNFHVLLNLVLGLAFLPMLGPVSRVLARLLPAPPVTDDHLRPRHLDEGALGTPNVAIACAARETLRIADQVEAMLARAQALLTRGEAAAGKELGGMDDSVDALHSAVKLYLARLPTEDMDEADSRRVAETMTFVINLEHMGDIIDRNLKDLGRKLVARHLAFSAEGRADIDAMFGQTRDNLKAAVAVFLGGDVQLARRLVSDKAEIRKLERRAAEAHFARIRSGRRESIETSALHLDVLRDLKRINAHIAAVAYPILEQQGQLKDTRLREARS